MRRLGANVGSGLTPPCHPNSGVFRAAETGARQGAGLTRASARWAASACLAEGGVSAAARATARG